MVEFRSTPFIYLAWVLATTGWILILSGVAALQQNCGSSSHDAIALGGVAGFLGPIECSKFYGYTWWITWYLFLAIILIPSLLGTDSLAQFRAGTLGLLAPLTMLVNDTANTFLFWNHLALSGTAKSRARTVVAGSIIASIALYLLIILIGLIDEKKEKVETSGEPKGETYGGRFVPKPGTTTTLPPSTSPTSQYNPTYEEMPR